MKKNNEENAKCSIDGCSCNDDCKSIRMQVICLTEQNDGFNRDPYFCMRSINLCKKHLNVALSGKQIFSVGLRGYNRYFFKEGEDDDYNK